MEKWANDLSDHTKWPTYENTRGSVHEMYALVNKVGGPHPGLREGAGKTEEP